jgi:hypothetical protein
MDNDDDTAIIRDTAQAPAGPDSAPDPTSPTTQQPNSSSKPPSSSNEVLRSLGAAADDPERLDVFAPPAAASVAWQPRPDGTVTLTHAVAAMADADDPGEDDVDRLQVRPARRSTLPDQWDATQSNCSGMQLKQFAVGCFLTTGSGVQLTQNAVGCNLTRMQPYR